MAWPSACHDRKRGCCGRKRFRDRVPIICRAARISLDEPGRFGRGHPHVMCEVVIGLWQDRAAVGQFCSRLASGRNLDSMPGRRGPSWEYASALRRRVAGLAALRSREIVALCHALSIFIF